jgi:hypothetical protein
MFAPKKAAVSSYKIRWYKQASVEVSSTVEELFTTRRCPAELLD